MTPAQFRNLALSLPGTVEKAHMGHPDFRVREKIFATLGYPDSGWGMAKLTPEQQQQLVERDSAAFTPVKGAWGRRGCTSIRLQAASPAQVKAALHAAWRNLAPKGLIQKGAQPRPE
jgi:hypothetical protein